MKNIIKSKTLLRLIVLYILIFTVLSETLFCGALKVDVTDNKPTTADMCFLKSSRLEFSVNKCDGVFTVLDKETNLFYSSNPLDYMYDDIAQGINLARMRSQLVVTYLQADGVEDEVNSFNGCNENGLIEIKSKDDSIIALYDFAEHGFKVPLVFSLEKDKLNVKIDYEGIDEYKTNKILDITLLPFFAAAKENDEGYYIIPDGSGAYVSFNNGRYSQGVYSLSVYGGDKTELSENKPNNYQQVLIPAYAEIFTAMSAPKTSIEDSPQITAIKAGFVAIAKGGAAGAHIDTSVSGLSSSYNTISYNFLYRSNATASFLSRTWAALTKKITATVINEESPIVEYTFLSGDDADIKGAAMICSNWLFDGAKQKGLNDTLYLDICAGLERKHQFLGFAYNDIFPLTTLDETDEILTELSKNGINNFSVMLRGLSNDGGYYGKISSKLSLDNKIGSKKELKALIKKWENIYPQFNLTQFTKDGNGVYSFFHAATGINKKTVKIFEYLNSTGLRDYDKPIRYLLQPKMVTKSLNKLQKSLNKNNISTAAFSSLANEIYGNYTGDVESISGVKQRFAKGIADISYNTSLMLERPNDYAIAYANRLIYMPSSDSGHFVSEGAVPFLQMILDGYKSYSTTAANYNSNLRDILLFAIESNSALAFSVIKEEYKEIENTNLNNLYASTFSNWKEEIVKLYNELEAVRQNTEHSEIANYDFISSDVRRLTFENGAKIILNYGIEPYTVGDITIPSKSYEIIS